MKWLWLIVTWIVSSYFWLTLKDDFENHLQPIFKPPYLIIFLLIVAIILFWVFDIFSDLKKQVRHPWQASWIFYAYWSIALAPLGAYLMEPFITLTSFDYDLEPIVRNFQIFLGMLALHLMTSGHDTTEPNLAQGTVGCAEDKFTFKVKAKQISDKLLTLPDPVSVLGIFGEMGTGKSSFSRMIVEHCDPSTHLFTYISLTETNEASDFAKLFSERWENTLSSRYPKLNVAPSSTLLTSLLRENGYGVLSHLLAFLHKYNKGLTRTEAKIFQLNDQQKNKRLSPDISAYFGHISEIYEDNWVIIIDEVERSPIDEIYRLIEILERFKQISVNGLPVKLIFILCVDLDCLECRLKAITDTNKDKAKLIHSFIGSGSKNITHRECLPPISSKEKINYFKDELKPLIKEFDYDQTLIEKEPSLHFASESRYLDDPVDRLNRFFHHIELKPLRVFRRCVEGVTFFLHSQNKDILGTKIFPLSDLLVLEYLKLEFPKVFSFIQSQIPLLLSSDNSTTGLSDFRRGNAIKMYVASKAKNVESYLVLWIEKIIGEELSTDNKFEIEELFAIAPRYFKDFIEDFRDKRTTYANTLSDPSILYQYLRTDIKAKEVDSFNRNRSYFEQDQRQVLSLKNLDEQDLISYSEYIRREGSVLPNTQTSLFHEFQARLLQNANSELLREYLNQVSTIFTILGQKATQDAVFELLDAQHISFTNKFNILIYLTREASQGDMTVFNKLLESNTNQYQERLDKLFEDFYNKYIAREESIYEDFPYENILLLLKEIWSGENNQNELIRIQNIALKGLVEHPNILKELYWDNLYDNSIGTWDKNMNIYMNLKSLIAVTKKLPQLAKELGNKFTFWENIRNDQAQLIEFSQIKVDSNTLHAILKRKGLLSSDFSLSR